MISGAWVVAVELIIALLAIGWLFSQSRSIRRSTQDKPSRTAQADEKTDSSG